MKILKKFLCGILSATMLITAATIPAMAEDDIKVMLDGETLSFDVPPQIINDRTMVPLRAIFEALGARVVWQEYQQGIESMKNDISVGMNVGNDTMHVRDRDSYKTVTLDAPPCIVNDRTLVPVRAIAEAYNVNVDWDGASRTVKLTSNSNDSNYSPTPCEILRDGIMATDSLYYSYATKDGNAMVNADVPDAKNSNAISIKVRTKQLSDFDHVWFSLSNDSPPSMWFNDESLKPSHIEGTFDKDTHQLVLDSDISGDTAEAANNIVNTCIEWLDEALKADFGLSANELGIAATGKGDSSVISHTQSDSYEKLKSKITSDGKYDSSDGSYALTYTDLFGDNNTTIIIKSEPKAEYISMQIMSPGDSSMVPNISENTWRNTVLYVYKYTEARVAVDYGLTKLLYGNISNSTQKFEKENSTNMTETEEIFSKGDISVDLKTIDRYLTSYFNTGVSLKDLKVLSESTESSALTSTQTVSTPSNDTSSSQANVSQSQDKPFKLDYEYGPMTIERTYSTGKHWITNNISSFVFTKCEKTSIGKYKLYASMQGIADDKTADVKVYFYDANNRVLDEVWFYHDVSPNVNYNVLIDKYVAEDVIDNAVRIEFYSWSGEAAVVGK